LHTETGINSNRPIALDFRLKEIRIARELNVRKRT